MDPSTSQSSYTVPAGDLQFSCLLPLGSKPRIQRRHSLHSPTGEPRQPVKQIASMDSTISYRPHSMVIDFPTNFGGKDGSANGIEDPTLGTLQQPSGSINRARSMSNQNLVSAGFSFAAQPHTCSGSVAPTNSQLQVTPAAMGAGLSLSTSSGRPKLIKQFSQASPCAADSPSPVERDGVLPSSSSFRIKSQKMGSVDVQYNADAAADRASQTTTTERSKPAPKVSLRRGSKDKQYLDTSSHPSIPFRTKVAPNHSHSNPEFPLVTQLSMGHTERTYSYDDLYSKRRRQQFQAQAEDNEVSPSREKINSLSSQIYSSLDQNWATTLSSYASGSYHHLLKDGCVSSEANPVCEVMQKIIHVTTPLLHLNQAHMQTLMASACPSTPQETRSSCASLSSHCSEEGDSEVYDSPTAHLLRLGYKLIDKPLMVTFGSPCDGHMTLTFELMDLSPQKRDTLLKVRMTVHG